MCFRLFSLPPKIFSYLFFLVTIPFWVTYVDSALGSFSPLKKSFYHFPLVIVSTGEAVVVLFTNYCFYPGGFFLFSPISIPGPSDQKSLFPPPPTNTTHPPSCSLPLCMIFQSPFPFLGYPLFLPPFFTWFSFFPSLPHFFFPIFTNFKFQRSPSLCHVSLLWPCPPGMVRFFLFCFFFIKYPPFSPPVTFYHCCSEPFSLFFVCLLEPSWQFMTYAKPPPFFFWPNPRCCAPLFLWHFCFPLLVSSFF